MTVKIHIPSSDPPGSPPEGSDSERPAPGWLSLITAIVAGASMVVVIAASVVSGEKVSEPTIPAPFEPSEPVPALPSEVEVWTERTLPGDGEIIAMGTVADTAVAVVRSRPETFIWRLDEGAWQLEGNTDLVVESAVVMDDRILLLADQGIRSTVWEWVGGSARYVFQPMSGSVVGVWSVSGRLFASVAPSEPGLEQTVRFGRSDVLWTESLQREFTKVTLSNIESVLAVAEQGGEIVVGGRDADGVAAVGFLDDGRVHAKPVPGAPPLSAVSGFGGDDASRIAVLSVANRRRGTHGEVRAIGRDWGLVTDGPDLVGVEVIDDVVVGVTRDGVVLRHRLDGEELPAPASPPWSYGFVLGLALLDGEPVAYGQSATGSPVLTGPSVAAAEIMMPIGRWERYHFEAADGFHLFHIGSLEFATRDAELFYRAWNADRWHPTEADGGLVLLGVPRIVEMDWGFVLIPPAGGGLWFSADGSTWERIEGTDTVRAEEVAANGTALVGMTHYGALGGPTSDVTVLNDDREPLRFSLPNHIVGLAWEEGVGFVGSVVPPGSGYVTSPDGVEWTRHDGPERFDWVVAFDGGLYLGTGDSVIEGDPPADTPGGPGWLFLLGETPAYQDGTGTMWLHTGDAWVDASFGVAGGLPERPDSVIVRGPRMFAMVVGVDGLAQTYVLELD